MDSFIGRGGEVWCAAMGSDVLHLILHVSTHIIAPGLVKCGCGTSPCCSLTWLARLQNS